VPRDSMTTAVTAFTITRRGPLWLMLRHERLGATRWELPGGHVDYGESLEQAAARETLEETGVPVEVGRLLATCVHEWIEQGQRKLICFFEASAVADDPPKVPAHEPSILEAAWLNPVAIEPASLSAFLHPLVAQEQCGWAGAPIHFQMTHRADDEGIWQPVPTTLRSTGPTGQRPR